tara:strand:- start:2856 stop:3608 length:753 start_codon:yes stop_codon:yes gene_type:complete
VRLFIILLIFLSSCASKKDILLIQDSSSSEDYSFIFEDIIVKPDDILRIKISSNYVNIESIFSTQQSENSASSILAYQIEGYLVNSEGFINIPILDFVFVENLTPNQVAQKIKNLLNEQGVLKNASVDVKIINSYFTVLGEVNLPGRYTFLENNMSIFQALGMAGDLTINGKRDDIKIVSNRNGNTNVISVDLTSSELLSSKAFQIFPGDTIIVNANNARVKNAGVVGDFGNLLTALSFILSSIILITNN